MGPSCVCAIVWMFEPIHFTDGGFNFKVYNYYKEVTKNDVNDFCCYSKLNYRSKNENTKSEVLS